MKLDGPSSKGTKGKKFSFKRLKLIPKVLGTGEKLLVLLAIVLMLGGITWFAGQNYINSTVEVPQHGGTLSLGLVGQPRYINPLLSPTSDVDQDMTTLVFASLFKFDKDFKLQNDLAESLSISEDKKAYTVKLKSGLTWHDGEPLTAADVIFTVKSIQDPSWNSPLSLGFKGVTVEQTDELTLVFKLDEVYSAFASSLTFGILPQHLWASVSGSTATLAEANLKPIGSGPYKFKELTKDRNGKLIRYKLVANDTYHAGEPFISEIKIKFYDQIADVAQAYQEGDVDTVNKLPVADAGEFDNSKTNINTVSLPRYDAIFLNANKNTELQELKVRAALAHAIKKSDLVDKILMGNGNVINSPLVPGTLGYTEDVHLYSYDPELSKKQLTEEGFKVDKDGFFAKDDKRLVIELVTADTPENKKLAEAIAAFWKAINVETKIKELTVSELQQDVIRNRSYQTLLFGEVIGADPDLYPFWHSTQITDPGLNLTSFTDEDLDELLEQARQATDPKERAGKQTAISKILAENLHAIFLYSPNYLYASRSNIKGIDLENINLPADRFNGINEWYIKTKRVSNEGE